MKILKSQKGFTLVEILVVMGIIAMLSTLAVNGYLTYRRSALLDLGADNLVSQFNLMKAKATYGSGTDAKFQELKKELDVKSTTKNEGKILPEDNISKCFGLVFEKGTTNFTVNSFAVKFVNTKVWKHISQSWGYQGCEDVKTKLESINLDAQMKILSITDDKNSTFNKLVFRFLPPNGKLEAIGNVADQDDILKAKIVKIRIGYGDNSDPEYQREINFDLSNSKAIVNKVDLKNVQTN